MRCKVLAIAAVAIGTVLMISGCGSKSDDPTEVTCAEVLTQPYEARRVSASIAALKLDIPHAHNDIKKDIEAIENEVCHDADPDDSAYDLTVARLEEQAP